ncbi:hypothetical protein D8I24_6889 (plasmid) [Cupriavidus necator H850]|nr:hypothetical protein D8I24_6889 [Cupriavidus necator H850]
MFPRQGTGHRTGPTFRGCFQAIPCGDFSSSRFQPRIDVVDDGTALRITAELPGMDREENGCYRLERAYGAFMRSIPLPDGIDLDHIDAKFERGVLTLRLPKTGSSQSAEKKIEVK